MIGLERSMNQSTRAPSGKKSAGKTPSSTTEDTEQKGRRRGFLIASLIIVVLAIAIGIGYYLIYVRPLQTKIIVVGEDSVNIGYFIKRLRMETTAGVGGDPNIMLETLTHEMLVRQGAPQYGIEVTDDDIDETLREVARGQSEAISDSEFNEWYRQQLNESEFSDSEYRNFVRTFLLRLRLHEYLAERVPTVTEQVHLHIIIIETYEDALEVRERWEAGEDFADLAREVSIDEESRERGGDVGWYPPGVLDSSFMWAAVNLDIGEVSTPLRAGDLAFSLVMISEKAVARELDEESLALLRAKVIDDWLVAEMGYKKIEFHGFKNGFDSETYAWIQWQLSKGAE